MYSEDDGDSEFLAIPVHQSFTQVEQQTFASDAPHGLRLLMQQGAASLGIEKKDRDPPYMLRLGADGNWITANIPSRLSGFRALFPPHMVKVGGLRLKSGGQIHLDKEDTYDRTGGLKQPSRIQISIASHFAWQIEQVRMQKQRLRIRGYVRGQIEQVRMRKQGLRIRGYV
jgi:hypothetical protein